MSPLPLAHITGLVLAGGRGARMGGIDKGLQLFNGVPLAEHSLQRLRPQVGRLLLSANRNFERYAEFGAPVLADDAGATGEASAASATFAGPLAGFLAGLLHCGTPYLATVPCDTPYFPADLVARLAAALVRDQAQIAMAASPEPAPMPASSPSPSPSPGHSSSSARQPHGLCPQPVFCLIDARLGRSLARFMAEGGRRVHGWAAQHVLTLVPFEAPHDDATAFSNANTLDELHRLASGADAHLVPPPQPGFERAATN